MISSESLPEDFEDLRGISAQFGADPMHIQGAGGNVSLKADGVMWIKASGTLLADAQTSDIFVATDLTRIQKALDAADPIADQPKEFLLPGGSGLRPSIETSLHAVFDQRIVFHTHCIHTLAHAIRTDAQPLLEKKLSRFDWAYVGYTKPGANLARDVRDALAPQTNVIVLGNHGLIVAGETAAEVEHLQRDVHDALALAPSASTPPDLERLSSLATNEYQLPEDLALHQIARDEARVSQVTKGSLYPDHVIFCGIGVEALGAGEDADAAVARVMATGRPAPVWLIVPGAGVLVRKDAGRSTLVMMRCLADVMTRVPGSAPLTYLSLEQNLELLNWDAEKYRQSLNAR